MVSSLATCEHKGFEKPAVFLGAKKAFFAPFYTKTDHFSKTGSGQMH